MITHLRRLKKSFPVISVVCTFLIIWTLGMTAGAAEKVYKMTVPSGQTMEDPNTLSYMVWKQYVEANTGGGIQMDLYPAGQLAADEDEIFEGVKYGTYQAGNGDETVQSYYDPMMILGIPYLFEDERIAREFFLSPFFQELNREFIEHTGVRIIDARPVGLRSFFAKKPIRTLADLKGMKFRVKASPIMVELVKALGGSPTPVPWPELYTALKTGVVDGAEGPPKIMYDNHMNEVTDYWCIDEHVLAFNLFYVNEKWFQSLPYDFQFVLTEGARMAGDVEYALANYGNRITVVESLEAEGDEVYFLPPGEKQKFKEACQEPVLKWLKEQIGQQYIDRTFQAIEDIKTGIEEEM